MAQELRPLVSEVMDNALSHDELQEVLEGTIAAGMEYLCNNPMLLDVGGQRKDQMPLNDWLDVIPTQRDRNQWKKQLDILRLGQFLQLLLFPQKEQVEEKEEHSPPLSAEPAPTCLNGLSTAVSDLLDENNYSSAEEGEKSDDSEATDVSEILGKNNDPSSEEDAKSDESDANLDPMIRQMILHAHNN